MSTSVSVEGRELIAAWIKIDRGIAEWVLRLAAFDASGAWTEDGYGSCASWLAEHCGLGRSTAHEKLKVAHELTRRHVVRSAFEEGLSYTKVRLLVRLEGVDDARDEEFVAHAATDSIRMLEHRINTWNWYANQDKTPTNLDDHYGIRRERGFGGGMGRIIIEAPDDMLDRLDALIDAYGEFLFHNTKPQQLGLVPVDESATQTPPDVFEPDAVPDSSVEWRPRSARRLDWLFDLLEEAQLADPKKLDPYLAVVGVTIQYEDLVNATGIALTDQGTTLTGEAVRRMCCDAGIQRIVVKGASEILDYGREERFFSRAQRRLVRARHGHRCAVRGCGRRITQIHHLEYFEDGGETNIANGIPLCSYHHHLVHDRGWVIEWNQHRGLVRFLGPRGQVLESESNFARAA